MDGLGHWALLNLILAILTGLLTLCLFITYFTGVKSREDEEEENYPIIRVRRHGKIRVASIIPLILAVLLFVTTEDMTLPMGLTDEWTIVMAFIAMVQGVITFLAKKESFPTERKEQAWNDK